MTGRNARGFAAAAVRGLLALAVVAAVTAMAAATVRAGTTANIRAVPGEPGALITGAVLLGERDVYRLSAGAGQTLTVEMVSVEENAVFQIFLPGKGNRTLPGAGPMDAATRWSGKLPAAGIYRIVVGGARGNAEYTLRVDMAQ